MILSAGAGSVFWIAVVQPSVAGSVDPWALVVSLAYPVMDLILLALGLRVVLGAVARPRYLQFLVAGMSLYFIADVIYAVMVNQGSYTDGNPVDAGWIIGVLLIAVAALHPSAADPVSASGSSEARISRARFALLAGAALIGPAMLLAGETHEADDVVLALIFSWIVLFALVLVRLATTVDLLAISLTERHRLQDSLAHNASHDPLTKLANRLLFEARLNQALTDAPNATASSFSISTTSRRSMTPLATRPATTCCGSWERALGQYCAERILPSDWGG